MTTASMEKVAVLDVRTHIPQNTPPAIRLALRNYRVFSGIQNVNACPRESKYPNIRYIAPKLLQFEPFEAKVYIIYR